MDPLGLGPAPGQGPDPAYPASWFESGDHWYVIGVFPVRLSHGFALSLGISNRPIWGVFCDDLLGAVAARIDPRHKLVVWRKLPPLLGGTGWLIVHVELHPDQESADDRRTEMVAGWDPRLFADAPAISAREARRTLRDARHAATGSAPDVSRVIFMCGPSGSGKSTYARRLEDEGMVRLSFDEEMWRRGITDAPLPPEIRDEIEAGLRARLLELVGAGTDVVLDFSFWSRRMRDDYRALLAPTGVEPETVYLATDRETVLARVRARRGKHPDDFVLSDELAAQHFDHFEPPSPEEGPLEVVR